MTWPAPQPHMCIIAKVGAWWGNTSCPIKEPCHVREATAIKCQYLSGALPPPIVTANPAEVVEGEVRWDQDAPYTVHSFDSVGCIAIHHRHHNGRYKHIWAPDEIACDRLVSRPGVTL